MASKHKVVSEFSGVNEETSGEWVCDKPAQLQTSFNSGNNPIEEVQKKELKKKLDDFKRGKISEEDLKDFL